MRVLQVIDTLRPGGAERMAVNIANLLCEQVDRSFLCCTRDAGALKEQLDPQVGFISLKKKHSLDLRAFYKLRRFIIKNEIDLVHAHSTSWFFSVLVKLTLPDLKLVWHDHYGESESLSKRKEPVLKLLSGYFDGVITVNDLLKGWVENNLGVKRVRQINNFVVPPRTNSFGKNLRLKGDVNDFKIICIANLRPQKDHLTLIEAFECLSSGLGISLHLIGGDPGNDYSRKVLQRISSSSRKDSIFYYGSISAATALIEQADLGVLASRSEGLPLVLLEYGLQALPVVCTDVGQNREVVADFGKIVSPGNPSFLAKAMETYVFQPDLRIKDGEWLRKRIYANYSAKAVLPEIIDFYREIRAEEEK